MPKWVISRPRVSLFIGIIVGVVLLGLGLALKPFTLREAFTPNPAQSFAEALARVEAIQAAEAGLPDLNPECNSILMTHEEQVAEVIVFIHGFTSCPVQFAALGEAYFDLGYNVLIPRQPRHGLTELKGTPLKGMTAEDYAAFGTQVADIAQGLGERVIVVGLSGGGAIATWLAQERADIDLAVPVAPFLGVSVVPRPLTRPLTNLILLIPDRFVWWEPEHQMDSPNIAPYSYRGYYLHALFENLRLGFVAEGDAKKIKPSVGSILVITNANDAAVNNEVVAEFEQLWLDHGEQFLQTFQFAEDLGLPHDLITATHPESRVDIVYPQLLELIQ